VFGVHRHFDLGGTVLSTMDLLRGRKLGGKSALRSSLND
jgi:hypothetical protein